MEDLVPVINPMEAVKHFNCHFYSGTHLDCVHYSIQQRMLQIFQNNSHF